MSSNEHLKCTIYTIITSEKTILYIVNSYIYLNSRFEEDKVKEPEQLLKVFDVDGAARAPLSGIVKIEDSGRFMERVFESQKKAKAKREEKENLKRMQEQQQKLTQIAQQVSDGMLR